MTRRDAHRAREAGDRYTIECCRACGTVQVRIGAIRMGLSGVADPGLLLEALIRAAHRHDSE